MPVHGTENKHEIQTDKAVEAEGSNTGPHKRNRPAAAEDTRYMGEGPWAQDIAGRVRCLGTSPAPERVRWAHSGVGLLLYT